MLPAGPETAADLARMIQGAKQGHAVALGIHYAGHGPDWCALSLAYDRRLISDVTTGVLASGPIVSLVDMAAAIGVWLRKGETVRIATLDLRLDYLRPSRSGSTVTARMECYRLGRRIAFVRGIAHDGDEGDPIAHATGTFAQVDALGASAR